MKKKLNKHQTEDGHDQEGHSSSHPKGQWERRLQTDIQMAKQALSEALSLDKPTHNILPETKPSGNNSYHSSAYATRPDHASSYASSYENISRLLENWMKSPNSGETNSGNSFSNMVTTGSSSNSEGAQSTTPDHAFDSLLSFKSDGSRFVSVEENNSFTTNKVGAAFQQDERKPNSEGQVPLTLLENWLFDDGAAQCHEDLMNMSLEESTSGLF